MKAVILADLHFHNFQQFATVKDGINSRLWYTLNAVEQAFQYCLKHDIKHVLVLGDVFHSHSKIDVDVIHHVYSLFRKYTHHLDIHMVVGNHDQSSSDGMTHSLSIFTDICNVIDKPTNLRIGSTDIFAMPHMRADDFKAATRAADVFLFHQGLNEGAVGSFNITLKTNISLKDLPDARFRLGGHYHKHQQLDKYTWYVGSPLQHNFGERGETKGFVVLDTEAGTVRQIETKSPRFYQFDSVEAFKESGVDPAYDHVRLVLDSDQDVQLDNVQVVHKKKNEATDLTYQPQSINDKDLMERYVSLTNSELDVDILLSVGEDILEGVEHE